MKILLINPPQTFYSKSRSVSAGIPLGLLCIASMIDRSKDEVDILDALIEQPESTINEDGSVTIGMPFEQIKAEMASFRPDIIGITNPFSTQLENAIKVAELSKAIDKNILIVIGGPHVSIKPVEVLEDNVVFDVGVIGEGEYIFNEIIERFRSGEDFFGIKGVSFRQNDKIVYNGIRPSIQNLDELPFPAYDLINFNHYFTSKIRSRASFHDRSVSMITSRGCPFNCIFCSIHLHMGYKWRGFSSEYVLNHIDYLVKNYDIRHIHFEDDNLTFDNKRFEEILDGLIKRCVKITWDTPNGIRADGLTYSIIKKMKCSGCTGITIGVESGVQETLDNIINKKLNLDKVIEVAINCKKLGVKLDAFYVIGFPGETIGNMRKTIDFALDLKRLYNVNMNLFVATPFYSTRLYDLCLKENYFTQEVSSKSLSESVQNWGDGLIKTEDFTPVDVKKIAEYATSKYAKLAIVDYVKNPLYLLKMVYTYPSDALRFLRNLLKFFIIGGI